MKEIKVGKNEENQSLIKLLGKVMPEAGKGFLYKMLRKKNIVLNGKKADGTEILKNDDVVKIFFADETFEKFSAKSASASDLEGRLDKSKTNNLDFSKMIVYEDDNVLFLNKPAGILSQKSVESDTSVVELFIDYLICTNQITRANLISFRPGICNRLDRNTSGLLVAGKSLIGLRALNERIKKRDVDKYYLALVEGKINKANRIDGYIIKNEKTNKVKLYRTEKEFADENPFAEAANNRIITEYFPIETTERVTLLRVKLITGKHHQIRAHLSSINHPIVGDSKYGSIIAGNMMLHAHEMVFHRIDKDPLALNGKSFEARPPKKFIQTARINGIKSDYYWR